MRGRLLYEIDDGQWNIPELRTLLETIAKDQATIEGYEVDREFPAIGHRTMLLNARRVTYEQGASTTVVLAFEDITARRGIERQLDELADAAQGRLGVGDQVLVADLEQVVHQVLLHARRHEAVAAAANDYDQAMQERTLPSIYRFGEGVVEGEDLAITRDEIRIPGFARPVRTTFEHPFPDTAD